MNLAQARDFRLLTSRYKRAQKRTAGLTVEGRRAVLEALRSGNPMVRLMVAKDVEFGTQLKEALLLAERAGVPIERLPRDQVDRYSATKKAQGVIAFMPDKRFCRLDELVTSATGKLLIVVLDGIQDPHNLGAIARTLEAFGGHGLVLRRERAAGVTPGALRASAGALEHLNVAKVDSIPKALEQLGQSGVQIVGLDGGSQVRCETVDFESDIALVVGSEHSGLSKEALARCDVVVGLPLSGKIESLNASNAAAILIYAATRSRR